ncbi:MAG TPA: SRPBCC family protein [Micromonosporaceae bacterium]
MKLEHGFTVPVPVAKAWDVLLDVPTVAPCMPGAALTSYEGDEFAGTVKVKVGPINLTYKGQGRIVERNEADRRAVLEASGREARGSGTAKATVTATLRPDGDGSTRVDVVTELNITGRPAQFGRGMMVDVGNKLIGQFAECLSRKVREAEVSGAVAASAATGTAPGQAATGEAAAATGAVTPTEVSSAGQPAATGAGAAAETTPAAPAEQEVQPIDLLEVTGAAGMAKRVAKYTVVFAVGVLVGWLLSRLGRG